MGRGHGVLLVALQVISLCLHPRAAAAAVEDGLPPILSPILSALSHLGTLELVLPFGSSFWPLGDAYALAVQCGRGSCKVSPGHAFGFVCDCDPGWTKIHFGDYFQFLPCVIPKCTFDYSCDNNTHNAVAAAPSLPPPPPSDWSLFDPCLWSSCGEGTCVKTSEFGHRCECSPGYVNLLNATIFPCFRECVFGADCEQLGIVLPHGSSSPSTPSTNLSGSAPIKAAARSTRNLIWIFLLMVPLAMVPRI